MRKDHGTLSQTIQHLQSEGYTEDFNLNSDHLESIRDKNKILVEDFEVDEVYRFEGKTNPGDASILYAISSEKHNKKGLMVDAYGTYSGQLSAEMIQKLKYTP